jgi:methionine-S-sulfoxide reductase
MVLVTASSGTAAAIRARLLLLALLLLCRVCPGEGWTTTISRCRVSNSWNHRVSSSSCAASTPGPAERVIPCRLLIANNNNEIECAMYRTALERQGFSVVLSETDADDRSNNVVQYRWNVACGMLQRIDNNAAAVAPRWIPIHKDKEHVLVTNGWSFLDADTSDPLSAFDVDAANQEGLYQPKWGQQTIIGNDDNDVSEKLILSSLGYSLNAMSAAEIMEAAAALSGDESRCVLLHGATDPPHRKQTNNGYDFSGSINNNSIEPGVFFCAISGLPLFASTDLSPASTATSGWLSFVRPLSTDHVQLISDPQALDQRTEVVCVKSGCHLGHYFGREEGYCINASALNFVSLSKCTTARHACSILQNPVSHRTLETLFESTTPSVQILRKLVAHSVMTETVALGAGCFWHVEFALRRLPGVVQTTVGYAGGTVASPSYKQVCRNDETTGHAEVVLVEFDPTILDPRVLFDCFLAMHDPTKVRAHGKHAARTGQYRSCILLPPETIASSSCCESAAHEAIAECQTQLNKDLSTQVRIMAAGSDKWFWEAEERHQRHDEKRGAADDLSTLSASAWLGRYGKRSESLLGSAETLAEAIEVTRLII